MAGDIYRKNRMKGQSVLFSKKSDEWETPQALFDVLHEEFDFDFDCAATAQNAKCKLWLGPGGMTEDALTFDWDDAYCWLNPPYSQCKEFVAKAALEASTGATVVLLLPARTDTKWFHEHIYKKHEVRFLKGRLQFGDSKNNAPFPSMIVVMRPCLKED